MITSGNAKAAAVNGVSYADVAALDDQKPTSYAEAATDKSKIPGPTFDLTNVTNGTAHGIITPPRTNSPRLSISNRSSPDPTPTHGDQDSPGPSPGPEDSPRTPMKRKRPLSRNGNLSGSLRQAYVDDEKRSSVEKLDNIIYEQISHSNGQGLLTSIKPDPGFAKALRLDAAEQKKLPSGQLVLKSGRIPSAGWETSGIRWAPLNIPVKRRLQTLAVLWHTLSPFLLLSNFFFFAAIPLTWPLLLPYLIYCLFSQASTNGNLKQRWDWLRNQKFWSLFASYYPARLHRTEELMPTRKYIFGYHPHGIISHGAFAAFGTNALGFSQLFPGITNTLLTLDSNFRVPFYREYLLWMGLCSVSKESCTNLLNRGGINGEGMGRGITIVIGGARESLETQPGTLRLVVNCRKGFVKLAVETGADLVPVICFGENEIYDQLNSAENPRLHAFQMFFKKMTGFTTPVFHARGIFNYDVGIMPYRRPMNIVVGRAITVEKQAEPDFDYVNQIHAEYVKELRLVYDTWKDVFAKDRVSEMEFIA